MLLYKPNKRKPRANGGVPNEKSHEEHKRPRRQPAQKYYVKEAAPVTNTIDEEPVTGGEKKFKGRGTQSHYESEENTLQSDQPDFRGESRTRPRRRGRACPYRRGGLRHPVVNQGAELAEEEKATGDAVIPEGTEEDGSAEIEGGEKRGARRIWRPV